MRDIVIYLVQKIILNSLSLRLPLVYYYVFIYRHLFIRWCRILLIICIIFRLIRIQLFFIKPFPKNTLIFILTPLPIISSKWHSLLLVFNINLQSGIFIFFLFLLLIRLLSHYTLFIFMIRQLPRYLLHEIFTYLLYYLFPKIRIIRTFTTRFRMVTNSWLILRNWFFIIMHSWLYLALLLRLRIRRLLLFFN